VSAVWHVVWWTTDAADRRGAEPSSAGIEALSATGSLLTQALDAGAFPASRDPDRALARSMAGAGVSRRCLRAVTEALERAPLRGRRWMGPRRALEDPL
jgi:hypothetical protein